MVLLTSAPVFKTIPKLYSPNIRQHASVVKALASISFPPTPDDQMGTRRDKSRKFRRRLAHAMLVSDCFVGQVNLNIGSIRNNIE